MVQKKSFLFLIFGALLIFFIESVSAHCPLCTIGAGAAAAGAVWLGVSKIVVALFIGGFAMSMGLWMSRIIKKKYFKLQNSLVVIGVFLLTFIPLLPIFSAIGPLYLSFIGDYGKTYAVNYSLLSGLFGGLVVFSSPSLSKKITEKREGKIIPFQGILLTLTSLIVIGILLQFTLGGLNYSSSNGSIETLSPDDFESAINNENVFLLNVHTPYEGKIAGTGLIVEDWENIENYMDKLPKNLSTPIAVYCKSGRMSASVAEKLKEMGYKVYDLKGGMASWEESGREIIA
ncbi:MAG: rhodanese-like domain-containing protein [archaeon]|nr:rhodanese-like domain-containing protein [archaeon]